MMHEKYNCKEKFGTVFLISEDFLLGI